MSQADFLQALGRHRKANVRSEGGEEQIPPILQGKAINPFISKEILAKSKPIKFRTPTGSMASGYRADLLPDVCEVYLKARDAGVLPYNQQHVAKQAESGICGVAKDCGKTGIVVWSAMREDGDDAVVMMRLSDFEQLHGRIRHAGVVR